MTNRVSPGCSGWITGITPQASNCVLIPATPPLTPTTVKARTTTTMKALRNRSRRARRSTGAVPGKSPVRYPRPHPQYAARFSAGQYRRDASGMPCATWGGVRVPKIAAWRSRCASVRRWAARSFSWLSMASSSNDIRFSDWAGSCSEDLRARKCRFGTAEGQMSLKPLMVGRSTHSHTQSALSAASVAQRFACHVDNHINPVIQGKHLTRERGLSRGIQLTSTFKTARCPLGVAKDAKF